MNRIVLAFFFLLNFIFVPAAFAANGDIAISPTGISISTRNYLEGKIVRIYVSAYSPTSTDIRGVIRIYDNGKQIEGDQPVSVIGGREDGVFVDFDLTPGEHNITARLFPYDSPSDNPSNNDIEKEIVVLADTDRDGIANRDDIDDDNDAVNDADDAFPLNKNESLDSDGDGTGNNQDDDDDNDGITDEMDAMPLDANENLDTDRDGIGNNADTDDDGDGISDGDEIANGTDPANTDSDGDSVSDKDDAFPLDQTQSRDYDRDGVSDENDTDADSDGIPKAQDTNDSNLGPLINITAPGGELKRIFTPNQAIAFETVTSLDPDGEIKKVEWFINGEKFAGEGLEIKIEKMGIYRIMAKLTDDKGESREKTLSILVIHPVLLWSAFALIFIILILAIFLIFFYIKPRRRQWEKVYSTLDMILNWLPKPKRRK